MEEWSDCVRWLGVYIAEAHTKDEWPMPCLNSACRHVQPKSIEHRADHAKEFTNTFRPPFPVLMDSFIDSWQDPFLKTFNAWPERFYVFQRFRDPLASSEQPPCWVIRWWNMPSNLEGHKVDDIRDWLDANISRPLEVPPPLVRSTSEALQHEQRLGKVKEAFEALDTENRGVISKEHMAGLFQSLGYLPDTCGALFEEVDIDKSGDINLIELELFFRSVHPLLQKEILKHGLLLDVGGPAQAQQKTA